MILVETLLIFAIGLAGAYVGWRFKMTAMYIITALLILVAAATVWIQGISPAPDEICLTATNETSTQYEAYCNVTDLFPKYHEVYPDAVSVESGNYVSGSLDDVHERDQVYLVYEDDGNPDFNVTWNFSWIKSACPEHMHWIGRYEGGSSSYFKWWVFNWTSNAWQESGNPQVDSSSSDEEFQYGEACNTDFINPNTTQLRLKMVTYNQGWSDEIYTVRFYLHSEQEGYETQTQIVNCTKDTHDETKTYDKCVEAGDNQATEAGEVIVIIMVLFSVAMIGSFMAAYAGGKKEGDSVW